MSLLNFLKSLFSSKKAEVEMPVTINPEVKKTKEVYPPLENKVQEVPQVTAVVEKKAETVEEVKAEPTVKEIKAKSAKPTEEPKKEKPKSKPKPKPKKDSK